MLKLIFIELWLQAFLVMRMLLAQENVISVAFWIHLGPVSGQPILPWFRVTSLVQSSFLAKHELATFFNCIFLPKRKWNSDLLLDQL